ncbi:MAG TPA: hypothetical protein VK817_03630 [Trebonia sp.]|jgi:hypothetical protein|nr:hypothetical protein [Trebonia sp.]
MTSEDGAAYQSGDTGQSDSNEEVRLWAAEIETAQAEELTEIDTALDEVQRADSREEAVASLIRATVGINCLYARIPAMTPLEVPLPNLYHTPHVYPQYESFLRFRVVSKETARKLDMRLEKYLKVANTMVEKWKPDQYQVSVGFPQLVSVTLTWNVQ